MSYVAGQDQLINLLIDALGLRNLNVQRCVIEIEAGKLVTAYVKMPVCHERIETMTDCFRLVRVNDVQVADDCMLIVEDLGE